MKKVFCVLLSLCLVNLLVCLPVNALDLEQKTDDSITDVFEIFGVETALTFEIVDGEAILVKCDKVVFGDITIPSAYNGYPVTKIATRAFRACAEITSLTLPDGLTTIGEEAFAGCTKLEAVFIPESVATIEKGAFVLCEGLKSVTLPDAVTYINPYTFMECPSLETVVLGNAVAEIGQDVFSGCDSLKNVNIPNTVTAIGKYAFWGCPITYLAIPNSVETLGERAFVEANIGTLRFYSVAQMDKFAAEFTANEVICLCENEEHTFSSSYDVSCNECLYKAEVIAPVVLTKDHSDITLVAVEGYEYSLNGVDFQESNVFNGLYVGNEYTFVQRVKAHSGEEASENSPEIRVATDDFAQTTVGGVTADYIKLSANVEDKQSYRVVVKYTAKAPTPIAFLTADADIVGNRGYVESENFAVKTVSPTDIEKTEEILFTVDKKSVDGVSQGDVLFLYVPSGSENIELSVLSVEKLTNATGGSVVSNGGSSILIGQKENATQALRYYFNYDTNTGNDVVIGGKAYTLVSRGFLLANGSIKADMLVSCEKAKTDGGILDMNTDQFSKCWAIKNNSDGTTNITYSNHITGFETEADGSYNSSKRLYVKGYIVIEADGEQFTLYGAETNATVSEIANWNYTKR